MISISRSAPAQLGHRVEALARLFEPSTADQRIQRIRQARRPTSDRRSRGGVTRSAACLSISVIGPLASNTGWPPASRRTDSPVRTDRHARPACGPESARAPWPACPSPLPAMGDVRSARRARKLSTGQLSQRLFSTAAMTSPRIGNRDPMLRLWRYRSRQSSQSPAAVLLQQRDVVGLQVYPTPILSHRRWGLI